MPAGEDGPGSAFLLRGGHERIIRHAAGPLELSGRCLTLESVEQWRPIPDWPGYRVSDQGQVWSEHSRRLLVGRSNAKGYRLVSLSRPGGRKREHRVHRLVLLAFVGPCPDGQEGRHLDGDSANNTLSNLAWGTPVQNAADARSYRCPSWHRRDKDGSCPTCLDILVEFLQAFPGA